MKFEDGPSETELELIPGNKHLIKASKTGIMMWGLCTLIARATQNLI